MKSFLIIVFAVASSLCFAAESYALHSNISYRSLDNSLLNSLDIYVPEGSGIETSSVPVMIMIHGGGWRTGDKSNKNITVNKVPYFISNNWIFVSINYRLSPEVKHPAHVEDVAAAIAWVKENITSYGGDADRIFIMGHSAGAHLAALVSTDESYLARYGIGLDAIKGVVLLDGAGYDIRAGLESYSRGIIVSLMYLNAFGLEKESWYDASPINHVAPGKSIPPFLIVYAGERIESEEISSDFALELQLSEVPVRLYHAKDKNHAGVNIDLGLVQDDLTITVADFLNELLNSFE
jgi:acetyl esterase/lipase